MGGIWRWEVDEMGSLCLESIHKIHQPSERFRVSPTQYPAGYKFSGIARAGRKYVLAGAFSITVGTSEWELQAGDIADLPEGEYQFRVMGSDPVNFVSVWELPPEVRLDS